MRSLKASLSPVLHTNRLTLELFDRFEMYNDCLLQVINSPIAHADMGDFGI